MKQLRIKRSRKKGFDLQQESLKLNGLPAVCIHRPTKWGNPLKLVGNKIFIDARYRGEGWKYYCRGDIYYVIYSYRLLWRGIRFVNNDLQHWSEEFKKLNLNELRDKNLACFCKLSFPCHGDVLLELLNK
jgi:hypothetical protein